MGLAVRRNAGQSSWVWDRAISGPEMPRRLGQRVSKTAGGASWIQPSWTMRQFPVFLKYCSAWNRPLFGVSAVAHAAIERSGVEAEGLPAGHVFRHSAATNLLRDNTPLEVIGTLLRHQST